MLDEITPLILTYNEAPNIERTLAPLSWARRIVVVDSGSADGSIEILKQHPKVETFHHPFREFAEQWNFGLDLIASPWVLSLDADYEVSQAFLEDLQRLWPPANVCGYRARFIYRSLGRSLRGSLYPPRTVLFRKGKARYRMDGHTQRVVVDGPVLPLSGVIYHDDRKPLSRWLSSQQRYAREEAEHLLARKGESLGFADRLRLLSWPAPPAVFLYTLFLKRCLFDGWPGWYYAFQRMIAEALLALEIIDRRLREPKPTAVGPIADGERSSSRLTPFHTLPRQDPPPTLKSSPNETRR